MKNLKKFSQFLLPIGVVVLVVAILLCTSGGWLLARKVIANLMLPIGILWLGGIFAILWPGLKLRARVVIGAFWVLFNLAGSSFFSNLLLESLEKPYLEYERVDEPLDALVVLGGGTSRTPVNGFPQLGPYGDRVYQAGTLYLGGQVGTLISTGKSVMNASNKRSLAEDTKRLWQRMGIPGEDILALSDPTNTAQEMAAVSAILKEYPEWKQVGLCTSAFHLNRAMKEARRQGLELIPVPSDFRSRPAENKSYKFSSLRILPQGPSFRNMHIALWEHLGALL
ncbi:MAG: YdcF family protein [Verrucomicrobiota bacterium]